MTSARRGKRGGRSQDVGMEVTKEEYAVAKFLRSNVPTKATTLCGMRVEYFVGSKAIDSLLASHWGEKAKHKESRLFESREDAVAFCQRLLDKKELFHRARKIVQNKKSEKDEEDEAAADEKLNRRRKKKEAAAADSEGGGEEGGKARNRKKKKESEEPPAPSEEESGKKIGRRKKEEEEDNAEGGTPLVKEKKKKRIKLDMHEDQTFIDGNEAYVWIYDPIRPTTFIFGLALVVGAIVVCLFPLWPEWMRVGAYYLSLAAAGLLGVILALSIFRYVLYAFLWLATLGKVQFFLLPNLTEDVGFFDSFAPFYELETNWGNETEESEKKKKKKRKKAKDSDGEAEDVDSDAGRKSPDRIGTEPLPDASDNNNTPYDELPDEENDLNENGGDGGDDNEGDEDVKDDDEDDDDPHSGVASLSGSDAEYEIITHGDFNNGEKVTS